MFLRWIHKLWKYFWTTLLVLLLVLTVVLGGTLGLLQLDQTKRYLADRVEEDFNTRFNGELTIGSLEGFIPFRPALSNVTLTVSAEGDSLNRDTVLTFKRAEALVDLWSLLQNELSIRRFTLDAPRIRLLSDRGSYSLFRILSKPQPEDTSETDGRGWIRRVEVLAPSVTISDGALFIDRMTGEFEFPEPFVAHSVDASMFMELSEDQRFLDLESFSAQFRNMRPEEIKLSGQVYNDDRFLEFNAFTFSTNNSVLNINGEIDGVNLYTGSLDQQIREADYDLEVQSDYFHLAEFRELLPAFPVIRKGIDFSMHASGNLDSLSIDQFSLGIDESHFTIDGAVRKLQSPDQISYSFQIRDMYLRRQDVEVVTGSLNPNRFAVLENLNIRGRAAGNTDSVNVNLDLSGPAGELSLRVLSELNPPFSYSASASGEHIDLGKFTGTPADTTGLNFDASMNGVGYDLETGVFNLAATVYNSSFNQVGIDNLDLQVSLVEGFLKKEYTYQYEDEVISGSGWIDFNQQDRPISLQGNTRNIDLSRIISGMGLPSTDLNMGFNMELQGETADRISGRANFDVKESLMEGDSVRAHQVYMDLNAPDQETRAFRLTSSFFDLSVTGDIVPSQIMSQAEFWRHYLTQRVKEEVLLETDSVLTAVSPGTLSPITLKGRFQAKDVGLLEHYWDGFPDAQTDMSVEFDLNADSSRLLATANIRSDTLDYNRVQAGHTTARLTASFRSDRTFKEFSSVDFESRIAHMEAGVIDLDSLAMDLSYSRDSLHYQQSVARFANNASSRLAVATQLSDSLLTFSIEDFYLGNDLYAWKSETVPTIRYNRDKQVSFEQFRFQNRNEFFALRGTMSPDRSDSLQYVIREVSLGRISDLIKGRVDFAGEMNGTVVTRSLTRSPSIQGDIEINKLTLENRIIGDASFRSQFEPARERFNTQISVITDSAKYADYLDRNDEIGQEIRLNGYIDPPDPGSEQDTLYYFDLDFDEIDLWVLPYIAPKAFQSVEGRASGQGYLSGNLEDYDFHTDFHVDSARVSPEFLNTNYLVNGHVVLDRQDWLVLDSLDVRDSKGGTGLLYGSIDLKNFRPISSFDLSLRMDRLRFLNNSFDPDVPFYGSISGTGLVRLSGPNTDLFLRTIQPIQVTSDSRLSIPLLEETELNENRRFIQFVDSFRVDGGKQRIADRAGAAGDEATLKQAIENLTFSERFNLDLQFDATNPMTVELIFDRITGEVLTANGTGQLRLTMEEGNVQMFGRYNITGGTYRFVAGDVITRKLELERGGTILWQGEPDNAQLDIQAVYRARPNINTLMAGGAASSDPSEGQRVPIELVVEITGTVSSVENDYYFRLPNTLEISSNAALAARINDLNRNDEEKLYQALGILANGQFINVSSSNEASSTLSQNLTRSSTYVNPLLSSQVISPLLSNQINALLKSDVSRLDIDFNLNTYNEIDLGVALRLYNDRLILRREGQITGVGQETTLGERIGDLNATYRINRGLSITAFHRQDQTLQSVSAGPQAGGVNATVDGVGLEAQVQFNTWKDLTRRIKNTIFAVFGGRKEEENDNIASDGSDNSDSESEEN